MHAAKHALVLSTFQRHDVLLLELNYPAKRNCLSKDVLAELSVALTEAQNASPNVYQT